MIAADLPIQRPAHAKLLIVDASGRVTRTPRDAVIDVLHPGDLLVANDAATLPASLPGTHLATGRTIEVRLAGRGSLEPDDVKEFAAVVFGEGDFRTRTEDRPLPPALGPGDRLELGPLSATILEMLDHPRLISLRFDGTPDAIWSGLARHGRPIQYGHLRVPLALWDVWTVIAGPPVAFEPPAAGFVLDWRMLAGLRTRHVAFATLTHAAGISSTGDSSLDARLPFDEPYDIPAPTALAIEHAQGEGRRIVAVGTTVVRALEHAARADGAVHPGPGVATQRIGPTTRLRIVNAILSGIHEPETSHYQLLRAFGSDEALRRAQEEMTAHDFRNHEYGDSVLIEAGPVALSSGAPD